MPKLIIFHEDGQQSRYGLNGPKFTIGRAADNDIVLPAGAASGHHALLKALPDGNFSLTDLGSTNHTRVNGRPVQSTNLRNGDELLFGDTAATYESEIFSPVVPEDQPTKVYESIPVLSSPERATPSSGSTAGKPAPYVIQRPAGVTVSRRSSGNSGCFSMVLFGVLLVAGFAAGLTWRHHRESGGQWFWQYLREVFHSRHPAPAVMASTLSSAEPHRPVPVRL